MSFIPYIYGCGEEKTRFLEGSGLVQQVDIALPTRKYFWAKSKSYKNREWGIYSLVVRFWYPI
ncbi:MAG TPA: hypothetical protein DEG17_11320 [Cyanobacteria bacterium UBA11149]|nr:hypothetical protein [Cyanobacteria bacterium UBA11366]HBK66084.1 hypothetical protein [Cyanobacteria bacterium UBA11166]HBR76795.1 hypothetical protein [Cyanobacteria bacterium UBA11159]HBS71514.1 hypothetical protein [Cyanobacteria bacterium UBA11153]HBW89436.1 hypothetical protein [Cyanobacteria bacterium UBA11149]HCA97381.1 hypothetical protein [Cyanobacteria bacterium UBA9226]